MLLSALSPNWDQLRDGIRGFKCVTFIMHACMKATTETNVGHIDI